MSNVRMILIRNKLVGVMALDDVFAEIFSHGTKPGKSLGSELLERVKKNNFIPAALERDYADALIAEYEKYYGEQHGSTQTRAGSTPYQGAPREEVPWFPTIKEDLCDGCKICFDFCPHDVFAWDDDRNIPIVKNPFNCIVGCSACAPRCALTAIVFPPRSMLDTFRRT